MTDFSLLNGCSLSFESSKFVSHISEVFCLSLQSPFPLGAILQFSSDRKQPKCIGSLARIGGWIKAALAVSSLFFLLLCTVKQGSCCLRSSTIESSSACMPYLSQCLSYMGQLEKVRNADSRCGNFQLATLAKWRFHFGCPALKEN